MKVLEDGPVLHFVASLGAVSERRTSHLEPIALSAASLEYGMDASCP